MKMFLFPSIHNFDSRAYGTRVKQTYKLIDNMPGVSRVLHGINKKYTPWKSSKYESFLATFLSLVSLYYVTFAYKDILF